MGFHFEADGGILDRPNGRQVGYIKDDVVFSGGNGTFGGRQVGYIKDDVVFSGGNGTFGGRQVGYIRGDVVFSGGNGTFGGTQIGKATFPHPRWNAAAHFLLT